MAKILMVIAPEGFQEIEYGTPKQYLEKKGHEVITTSTVSEPKGHMGNTVHTDLLLKDVKVEDYDAVAFVGGGGSLFYFNHPPALSLARSFFEANLLTCAICAAPSILANAGILKDKKATCFPSQQGNLIGKGVNYTGSSVEKDGIIITANGPKSAKKFAKAIHKALK